MSRVLPILFNTEMVRAILDGRKTVTRRVLKHPFEVHPNGYITKPKGNERLCPYKPPYQPGDILYVRETWCNANKDGVEPDYYYFADTIYCEDYDKTEWKWHPSIHMPKEAARIWLRVTDVRVERLRDITEEQAEAEGLYKGWRLNKTSSLAITAKQAFMWVWDMTITEKQFSLYGWPANPYVWVIAFEQYEKQVEEE